MSNRYVRIGVFALCFSLISAFAATPGSWDYYRFKIGNFPREEEDRSLRDSLKLFSETLAGFYASGGNPAGLNVFPAEKFIKRRIFQDIAINLQAELLLVVDRDRSDVREIAFSDRTHAVAIVDEAWFMQYQNAETRRPLTGNKANFVTVRYYLEKMWGKWIVMDYDVYGRDDIIPPARSERFVTTW